ncbi:hypothetical protein AB5I41_01710 [Sphingomonas sp. MMS24-JH45]
MTEKLEPCPFCGGEARCDIGKNAFEDVEVSCLSGGTQGPNYDDGFGRVAKSSASPSPHGPADRTVRGEVLIEALEGFAAGDIDVSGTALIYDTDPRVLLRKARDLLSRNNGNG